MVVYERNKLVMLFIQKILTERDFFSMTTIVFMGQLELTALPAGYLGKHGYSSYCAIWHQGKNVVYFFSYFTLRRGDHMCTDALILDTEKMNKHTSLLFNICPQKRENEKIVSETFAYSFIMRNNSFELLR